MVGVLLVGAMAACIDVDSSDDEDSTTTTVAADDTTTTSAAPDATTTTAAPADLGDEPPFHEDGPSGSGCEPGDDTGLPDGWWYGTVDGEVGDSVSFDLACYYIGDAAEEVAASRDDENPSGVYVVNDNPSLRSIPLAGDAQTSCVTLEPEVASVDCAPGDLSGNFGVWIRVSDGEVDRLLEQYHP